MPVKDALPKSKQAATRALELDDTFAEVYTTLAMVTLTYDWDWITAEQILERALELKPNYATAHHWHAYNLAVMGRLDEAIAEIKIAQQLDPLSIIMRTDLGEMYYYARKFDQALTEHKKALELDENFAFTYLNLGFAYSRTDSLKEAFRAVKKAVELAENDVWALVALASVYAKIGKTSEADSIFNTVMERARTEYVSPYVLTFFYISSGDKDRAFEYLEKAYQEHIFQMLLLKINPAFDSLRPDLRFTALLRRIGLEE